MQILEADLYAYVASFMFIFARFAGFMISMPVIGTRLLPARIRIGLMFLLTIIFLPIINPPVMTDLLSLESVIVLIQQILVGVLIGFSIQLVFQVFILLGEIVAMQSGLGFAVLNDPASHSSVPIVSQLYLMLVTLLFLTFDGHLVALKTVRDSFEVLPIGLQGFSVATFYDVANLANWMFVSAMNIALPAVTALLMVNIAFGVMTKAAPQLNIFSIGFPVTMILGVVVIWSNIGIVYGHFESTFQHVMHYWDNLLLR